MGQLAFQRNNERPRNKQKTVKNKPKVPIDGMGVLWDPNIWVCLPHTLAKRNARAGVCSGERFIGDRSRSFCNHFPGFQEETIREVGAGLTGRAIFHG